MKWIYFFDEIEQYLDEDEEILWSRKEIVNLLSIIPFTVKTILVVIVITFLLVLWMVFLEVMPAVILLLSLGLMLIIITIGIGIRAYRKITNIIEINHEQLKEYEFFYIITNKRYIRKDYYYHYKRDYSKYPKGAFNQIGDVVFLNLDYVEEIIVSYVMKEINFQIKNFLEGRAFFLGFKEKDEMEKVMGIIQTVTSLELLEKKMGGIDKDEILYIKYIKKEK